MARHAARPKNRPNQLALDKRNQPELFTKQAFV
jgi:hypothetical protein